MDGDTSEIITKESIIQNNGTLLKVPTNRRRNVYEIGCSSGIGDGVVSSFGQQTDPTPEAPTGGRVWGMRAALMGGNHNR